MACRVVLISDDTDFFEYIKNKISLRKSDELFSYTFDEVLSKIQYFTTSTIIINSESSREKTIELLKILNGAPTIVSAFNEDEEFKLQCYKAGAYDYITIMATDREFQARLLPVLTIAGLLERNSLYRKILSDKNIINDTNEVFSDHNYILDIYLDTIKKTNQRAVFAAIAPSDKEKLLLPSNKVETVLLNNIRKNDIIMNYASNKYFVILFDVDINAANKIWKNIKNKFSYPVYAGFCTITNQKREQLINEALNKLHEAINIGNNIKKPNNTPLENLQNNTSELTYNNFKLYKKEFEKKLEQVVTPVFYQIQQKYSEKISGVTMHQSFGDGYGIFSVKGKYFNSCFRVTSPGFSKINIDMTYQRNGEKIDTKRVSFDPNELEQGLLTDLLEQFVNSVTK